MREGSRGERRAVPEFGHRGVCDDVDADSRDEEFPFAFKKTAAAFGPEAFGRLERNVVGPLDPDGVACGRKRFRNDGTDGKRPPKVRKGGRKRQPNRGVEVPHGAHPTVAVLAASFGLSGRNDGGVYRKTTVGEESPGFV